ncbi:hypothetical protein ABHF91_05935 [Pseudaeromonas sp. ZJS20]|uniref:hypothetical protein n=1 Tax=Pseudaeromonas aegiceratis TaxID=3153928 RepID=UPI00390C615F
MFAFKPALASLYEKYGASAEDARQVNALFGQRFTELAQQMRRTGAGDDAKALAAVQIADDAFFITRDHPDGVQWTFIDEAEDFNTLLQATKAAGLCAVALYTHYFRQDIWQQYCEAYEIFLLEARRQGHKKGHKLDLDEWLLPFCKGAAIISGALSVTA